ncbi:MAG: ABC transporter ATP-binding protein [Planctomycetota bacterium]|jgi:ABC-2 type transport system ATP-binding protein
MDIAVETSSIRKEFGTLLAVNDANISIQPGQVVGLIGPNGAGKTTLLKILATVIRPTAGSAKLLGYDLHKEYLDIRKRIGYLPDFFNLYEDLTVRECLEFFAKAYGTKPEIVNKQIDMALEYVELEDKKNDFVRNLSRGMVQRMGVAVLLVHDPEVFILDEPASGLDPKARIQLRKVLAKLSSEGRTIIISSHILTELSGFCSHIAIMNKGSIALYGSVEDIQQKLTGVRKVIINVLNDCEKAVGLVNGFSNTVVKSVTENTITAEMAESKENLAGLNELLMSNGIKVFGFHEEKADIEDIFMSISGEK